jgi:uncharacterized protein (TIGR03118 family)
MSQGEIPASPEAKTFDERGANNAMRKLKMAVLGWLVLSALVNVSQLQAQSNSYKQTNLSSDTQGTAPNTDANMINPWGIAYIPGNPFWIADNNSGKATLYDKTGALQGTFTIPPPGESSNLATPTGVAANTAGGFNVNGISSSFLFVTEDGTISGWYSNLPSAVLKVDNSGTGAVYKGAALVTETGGNEVLLVANFNSGVVESYDSTFTPIVLQGTFQDPTLPAGFAPFGIHVIGPNKVVVTYAQQDALKHDPVHAAGAGYVSLFDFQGNFQNRIASQGTLNAPWGVAVAPSGFGQFQGALLVGNFGDGTINAFDMASQNFLGQLQDSNGNVITNASLWELLFDATGQTGNPGTLYITAGLNNEQHGLFAAITPNSSSSTGPADFSLAITPATLTISAGQTASFTVTATALNGFNSPITSFACSGEPAGTNCQFSKTTLNPVGGTTDSMTVTLATNSNPYMPHSVMGMGMMLPMVGFGLFGMVVVKSHRRKTLRRRVWWHWLGYALGMVLLAATLFTATGCGGYSSNGNNGTPRGTTTVMVTATSGSITHSASVSLTVQ